jgi:hypothetical protein
MLQRKPKHNQRIDRTLSGHPFIVHAGKGMNPMGEKSSQNHFLWMTGVQWTALGVIVAIIAVFIGYLAWRHPVSGPSSSLHSHLSKKSESDTGEKHVEQSAKNGPSSPGVLENKAPPPPKTFTRLEKEIPRVSPRTRKNEAQEHAPLTNTAGAGQFNFQITGSSEVEKNLIEKRLVDLGVKSAAIIIVKSELDDSRNVYIDVAYTDDIKRSYSFNTPLENAASLIISKIGKRSVQ